jgi:hypothetical protein
MSYFQVPLAMGTHVLTILSNLSQNRTAKDPNPLLLGSLISSIWEELSLTVSPAKTNSLILALVQNLYDLLELKAGGSIILSLTFISLRWTKLRILLGGLICG